MSRVKAETLKKLHAFIDELPDEVRSKCTLCNETLVHIVKTAEATIQAGTKTVCRALAERINKNAAQHDRVTGIAIHDRVRRKDGTKIDIVAVRHLKIARQSAERQVDISRPNEPIPKPVIDWGTEDPGTIERIKKVSNGHFGVDNDGTIYPVRDPEIRRQEHKVTMTIFPHLFDPIEGLTTCPIGAEELYGLLPTYTLGGLDKIDEAIEMLTTIKKLHGVKRC